MADRLFAKEGLVTSVNRDRIANDLTSTITGCENRLVHDLERGVTVTDDDVKTMYDPVFELLERRTREAWQAGDLAWRSDLHAVLDHVLAIYGRGHNDALRKLYSGLDDLWDQLENVSPLRKAVRRVGQMVIGFGRRLNSASQGLEKWAKTGTVDRQYGDQKYRS